MHKVKATFIDIELNRENTTLEMAYNIA